MKEQNKFKKFGKPAILILAVLIAGILIGRWTSGGSDSGSGSMEVAENTVWTCSMHPQIRQDHPGICPLCGMDLTPADEDDGDSDLPMDAIRMSPTAMQLAQVRTQVVSTGEVVKEIRLAGKVSLDPAQSYSQNAHFSGRIEEFSYNALGEYVNQGSKIAVIYSPELINAQKELLSAYKNRENAPGLFQAVKEKLRLWKIDEKQIEEIIQKGEPIEEFPVFANKSGYLIQKNVEKGDYVGNGESLFTLSQLTSLWGVFDIYEKDAVFVQKGMNIEYFLPSMPGKTFETKIDFVEPILNPESRTLTARIKINNPNLAFKPEMLINGILKSSLETEGDKIVIPKSAVMWTGKHSVVYVKYETDKHVGFQMRPVVLGPVLGDGYVIEEGLETGEEIVVEGTFSVDAAAQLANKPSMMNYENPESTGISLPGAELTKDQKAAFGLIFNEYFKLKDELVNDKFEEAKAAYIKLINSWDKTDWSLLPKNIQESLGHFLHEDYLNKNTIAKINDIQVLRDKQFFDLSNTLIRIITRYGPFENPVYIQHCPMAKKDNGADWLSLEKEILNPYYGASMLKCGEVRMTIED